MALFFVVTLRQAQGVIASMYDTVKRCQAESVEALKKIKQAISNNIVML